MLRNKSKKVKVKKDHQCWMCGKTIKKGDTVMCRKYYPREAMNAGMEDVSRPVMVYMCCGKNNG